MGYYTDVDVDLKLRADTPRDVKQALASLLLDEVPKPASVDHRLFSLPRVGLLLRCRQGSGEGPEYGFDGTSLWVRSTLKNYDGEIEAFVEWIRPYVEEQRRPIVVAETEDGYCTAHFHDGTVETFTRTLDRIDDAWVRPW